MAVFAVAVISLPVASALAQGSPKGQQGQQGQQTRPMDRDTMRDRPPMHDRDMMQDRRQAPERDRRADEAWDQQRDRARDQVHSPLRDQDIYGHELMSAEERERYRQEIRNAETAEERERLRSEHQAEIRSRAEARGVDPAPASEGPIYGGALMTAEERNAYREELRRLGDDRRSFMAEHREKMQQRAKERGIELEEETEDAE